MDLNNLQPVLEAGIMPVLKTTLTQTLYIPFGEAVVFAMILPYLNQSKKGKRTGIYALVFSGLALTLVVAT